MQKQKIHFNWQILILLVLAIFPCFSNFAFTTTFAETAYSNVLNDLRKDSSFNVENYPFKEDDYSLSVIQVAESVNKELFVYVYQPCQSKNFKASYLNMSVTAELKPQMYSLTLLNNADTLYKYKVEDFKVKDDETRQYEIISILRPFDETVDKQAEGDNKVTNVVFAVSKTWYATTYENKVIYQTFDTETIDITDKYVGYVRYPDGFLLMDTTCDSHFVAFSTNKPIDRLLEAKVYYATQSYESWPNTSISIGVNPPDYYYKFGDKKSCNVELNNTQQVKYTSHGWVSHEYSWNRISSVDEFLNNVNNVKVYRSPVFNVTTEMKITPAQEENLINKQWVLRFTETSYMESGYTCLRTLVGDVSILRLKFETDGNVYDLGVVDNMQTGSDEPINDNNTKIKIHWWSILLLAFLIGLFIAFPSILISLFNVLFTIIKYIFKGLWWLITAPLELLGGKKCSKE